MIGGWISRLIASDGLGGLRRRKGKKNKKDKLVPKYLLAKLKGRAEDAVRMAYYGGRNEIFILVMNKLRSYDYNSLYPTAMTMPMPVGFLLIAIVKT